MFIFHCSHLSKQFLLLVPPIYFSNPNMRKSGSGWKTARQKPGCVTLLWPFSSYFFFYSISIFYYKVYCCFALLPLFYSLCRCSTSCFIKYLGFCMYFHFWTALLSLKDNLSHALTVINFSNVLWGRDNEDVTEPRGPELRSSSISSRVQFRVSFLFLKNAAKGQSHRAGWGQVDI